MDSDELGRPLIRATDAWRWAIEMLCRYEELGHLQEGSDG